MTVKFRNHLSAEACVLVSALSCDSGLNADVSIENERSVLCRTTYRSVIIRW